VSKVALHDLTDPGKWDWGNLDVIPYLNSSKMMLLKFCPRLYHWKITKRLGAPIYINQKVAPMVSGTLYHAMSEAVDLGLDPLRQIRAAAQKIRLDPQYTVDFSECLDCLVSEMYNRWLPKYKAFISSQVETSFGASSLGDRYETLFTERELHVPLGKFVLSCIPDKVVRDLETGEIWVVERKTTSRDDSMWVNKFALNAQTTAEVLAVEKTLDKPVAGVYLEQVVVTKKRAANWTKPYPQPIANFTHHPWRPVPKSQHVKDEFVRFGEGIVEEIRWRNTNGREWDTNYASCERCEAKDVCLGRKHPAEVFEALPEDYAAKAMRLAHGISRRTSSQVISTTVKDGSDGI
jgi:hypothetical protein